MQKETEKPLQYCERKIKEAEEAADYQSWQNYQDLLALWRARTEGGDVSRVG